MMSEFSLDPQLKTLLVSPKYQYSNEMFSIVALLSVPPIFQRPSDKKHQVECAHEQCAHVEGDHLTLLNTYHDYRQNKSTVSVSFYQCSVNEIAPFPTRQVLSKSSHYFCCTASYVHKSWCIWKSCCVHIFKFDWGDICGADGITLRTGRSLLQTTYEGNSQGFWAA